MLDSLPYEVLENIAFWVGCICYPSSSSLLSVFLINKAVHDYLLGDPNGKPPIPENHNLFARLFEENFDRRAFERRFSLKLTSDELAAEYKKRVGLSRRMTTKGLFFEDLWTILIMIYEDDGKNMRSLMVAGVEDLVKGIILGTHEVDENNWPVENETVRLSFAILSLVSSVESIQNENPADQQALLQIFDPFVYAPHQYSSALFPITSYTGHDLIPIGFEDTPHAMGPMIEAQVQDVKHFGRVLSLASPSASDSALRAMLLRRERQDVLFLPNTPRNRAEADAMNRAGATQEDYRENNYRRAQALGTEVPHSGSEKERDNLASLPHPLYGSKRFDQDFWRLSSIHWKQVSPPRQHWFKTLYVPGTLTGKWLGVLQMPYHEDFMDMVNVHPLKPQLVDLVAQPMELSLREYVTADISQTMPHGLSEGQGIFNGWLPNDVDISQGRGAYETAEGLRLLDSLESDEFRTKFYSSFNPGMNLPEGEMPPIPPKIIDEAEMDVAEEFDRVGTPDEDMDSDDDSEYPPHLDVIVAGETEPRYGKAWGAYYAYGRLRRFDGFMVLVRVPKNPEHGGGRWIFSGYIYASTTILGQWRGTGTAMNAVGYSGSFMLTKVGDMWGPPPHSLLPSAGPSN